MSNHFEQAWGERVSTIPAASVSAAELRRRVRAVEALQTKTREMAAANVLTTRETAVKAARAKEEADIAAREAAAAVLRLFDNDADLVAELLSKSAEDLERDAKPVTAARASPRRPRTRFPHRITAEQKPSENALGPGVFRLAAVNWSGLAPVDEQQREALELTDDTQDPTVLVASDWLHPGQGHSPGESFLAASVARDLRVNRKTAREALSEAMNAGRERS
ncbi:hypothetical protein [Streptomyces sp. H39-S7]|uniref:hypothetical protein n=1 Tax=Streptomyces sp. H39-S7 TaxID=3004357 RepID=UPI0022AE6B29|nr:hypothetical protein [Streptomyces sp. H39-S7]MCZ4122375.1 hypothetical protein [Streptomyces sp. H39-S7]